MVPATLAGRLAQRIAQQGSLPVSEFVEACLYDPDDGFYMRGGRSGGRAGDYLTAPEVGPLFGAVLARALDTWWEELYRPHPFTVVDWGAGPGTLARTVLAAEPRCLRTGALRWVCVELSSAQRALHPDHPQVTSTQSVYSVLPESTDAGVVLANELLDNLPFDIVCRADGVWLELRVGVSTDDVPPKFFLVATPADRELTQALRGLDVCVESGSGVEGTADPNVVAASDASATDLAGMPVGACVPVQRAARRWVDEARSLFRRGRVVALDYGADTAELAARTTSAAELGAGLGWLRTHRQHSGEADWLSDPGSWDITTDVAFDQVQADHRAEVTSQAEFLLAHGISELVAEGQSAWVGRAAIGDLEALAARSRPMEAAALLDRSAMGSFKVLTWHVPA